MARPSLVVEFSPTTGPFETPDWISLSADGPHGNRVLSAEWTDGKQADLGDWPPGEATIVLDNSDRLFDPEHIAGDYFGQLNPRVPFRIRAVHTDDDMLLWDGEVLTWDGEPLGFFGDPTGYDLFYGFVEDGWEQIPNPPKEGQCQIRLVDLLAVLSGHVLPSVLEVEILADSPVGYWPLNETSGDVMRDTSGEDRVGEYAEGTTRLSTVAESPGIGFDGEHYGRVSDAAAAVTARPCVVEAIMIPGEGNSTGGRTFFVSGGGNPEGGIIFNAAAPTSTTWAVYGGLFDGAANNIAFGDTLDLVDSIRHVAMRRPAASAAKIYVDGVDATASTSTASTTTAFAPGVVIGHSKLAGAISGYFGFLAHVAVYDSDIGASRIAAHTAAALTPLDGLRSDEHVQWALDTIGVPATMYDLAEGESIMGPAFTAGQNALEFIRRVTNTEQGAFYVDHANGGTLRFDSRYHSFTETRSTITQATFTDDPASTDVRVERGTLRVEPNGVQTVFNQATVSWRGGSEVVDESAGSPYGPRPISIDTEATSPHIARGVGEWVISLNSTPQARVRSLGINPGAAQDGYPVALGTRIRDRVEWRSKPQDTGDPVTKSLEVMGRHTRTQGVHWETTYYLTASPSVGVTLFTLGTSELGSTDILAY